MQAELFIRLGMYPSRIICQTQSKSQAQVSSSKELYLTEVEFIWSLKSLLVIGWRVVKDQI